MVASPLSSTNLISNHNYYISRSNSLRSQWYRNSLTHIITSRSFRSSKILSVKNIASDQGWTLEELSTQEGVNGNEEPFRPASASVEENIKYHAEFTPSFSSDKYELPKAYYATAESVRDTLIENWNATYAYYEKINVKQAYYLSMEYLQGRVLLNAIGNLELSGPYTDALKKLGLKLEDVAGQEPDAAHGNGGLGRLASCFLDSLATLNYPAWGYGLRYKYGLFKQLITKDGQEEVAENWLEMGNPWEIVRNDVSYPMKFYGEVTIGADGKSRWEGGEDITALPYDVPIPGYKTKTTLNLRLWSTKVASENFGLNDFNAGEHAKALERLKRAEKICYILYPRDESIEGKTLRLKQQYTLCSASLQDIIAQYDRRSVGTIDWDSFPDKVAVQMNDTHPTLCIPKLIRILIDVKGLSWKNAWDITQRTVAYTNHTVLPEALEKWSFKLLNELLPRHIEIIKKIDEELVHTIISEYGTEDLDLLQHKLEQMRILNNIELPALVMELILNLEKKLTNDPFEEKETEEIIVAEEDKEEEDQPDELESLDTHEETEVKIEPDPELPELVRMANLCVVAGHAVNGVAEIHSEIVKNEVFNDFYKLWPNKFQNKTNGVTPRRWIRFCNPELSNIISIPKWVGTEDWVVNTEKLASLQKFADSEELQSEWREAKKSNKIKVSSLIKEKTR